MLLLTSCTHDSSELTADNYDFDVGGKEVIVNFTFDGKSMDNTTRALLSSTTDVYIYSYSLGKRVSNNLRYSIIDGVWKPNPTKLKWPTNADQDVSMYGLSESFKGILTDKVNKGYIEYEVPTENARDVYFGSAVHVTAAKSNYVLNMNFTRLVSRIHLYCKNSMENAQVVINKVEIHNLASAGRFDISDKTAGSGTWSLVDGHYGNYEQQVTDKTIAALEKKGLVTDTTFILIPQKTTKWATKKDAAVSTTDADANHQVYLAVYCQVYQKSGDEWNNCVWGNPNGETYEAKYKPIYIPLSATWSRSSAVKAITFEMGEKTMFKADGTSWEPDGGDQITFSESLSLETEDDGEGNVDLWEENAEDNYKVSL